MSTIALGHHRPADTRQVRHLHAVPETAVSRPVRLTPRGKAVILAIAVAIVAVLVVMFGAPSVAGDEVGAAPETTAVRIMPGTTLWEIAAEANPHGDIRDTVDEILQLNSLPNASALQMGSDISVPVYR